MLSLFLQLEILEGKWDMCQKLKGPCVEELREMGWAFLLEPIIVHNDLSSG